jgi:hypothetical protein
VRIAWAILSLLFLFVPAARAQERRASLEHAGSVGLLVGLGPLYSTIVVANCPSCGGTRVINGFAGVLDLGGSIAVGAEGAELTARLRLARLWAAGGESLLLGFRRSFGVEEWKTYFEIELEAMLRPTWLLGPRAVLGVMHDFSPVFGLYAEGGLAVDIGGGRRVGVDVTFGAQARSFLLQ